MSFKEIEESVLSTALSVFGEDVTYSYVGGGSSSIKGVFDNKYISVNDIATLKPTLTIKLSDLTSSPAKGDTILISSVNYRILESQPDGIGGSLLILQKV